MKLQVGKRRINFFEKVDVNMSFDSVASTFAFDYLFNPESPLDVESFKPFSYKPTKVYTDRDELLITGTSLSNVFSDSSVKQLASIGGYSIPGVLEDVTIPPESYPLQSDNLSISEIANKLLNIFGIHYVVDPLVQAEMQLPLKVSTAKETQSIKSYLSEICSQKNIIITHDRSGRLVFTRTKENRSPIAEFEPGQNGLKYQLRTDGKSMHSDITVMAQQSVDGGNSSQALKSNPFVSVKRPIVKIQDSGSDNDSELAASLVLANEYKSIELTITMASWYKDNRILVPGDIVAVQNPEIYLFEKTNFFLQSIRLTGSSNQQEASLKFVLPSVYDGSTPKNIFA